MKRLTKLSDIHYVIVDDSEIKEGDYVYDLKDKCIRYVKKYLKDNWIKKITHSTEPLEDVGLNTSMGNQLGFAYTEPLSLQECEELTQGYSIEKMALEEFPDRTTPGWIDGFSASERIGYTKGFKAHQKLVKDKLFTVEDMIKAFYADHSIFLNRTKDYKHISFEDWFNHNFKPKTEWGIEIDENNKMKLI